MKIKRLSNKLLFNRFKLEKILRGKMTKEVLP